MYLQYEKLQDVSHRNLSQVGVQSKSYLPEEPSESDNLPSPKVYISKLNVLEKLCTITKINIEANKKNRQDIINQLESLKASMEEGLKTDDTKLAIIDKKLNKLATTREELREILDEEKGSSGDTEETDTINTENANVDEESFPTYENSDSEAETPPAKRLKFSEPSEARVPPVKKAVAFSDNVEVNEYEKEEVQMEGLNIVKDDDSLPTYEDDSDSGDADSYDFGSAPGFVSKGKDAIELKHSLDSSPELNLEHSAGHVESESSNTANHDVLSLLAKLS